MSSRPTAADFLRLGPSVRVLPIIHGSGNYAIRVREELLEGSYDCLAVPLPPSFQEEVEAAIEQLPAISVVAQLDADPDDAEHGFSYVPIDPCQGVIAALRVAIGERIRREFIDMETPRFEAQTEVFPDPYALKQVSPEAFAAAVLPAIPPPASSQHGDRIVAMAARLRALESRYVSILFVCSLLDWPWIRDAYNRRLETEETEPFFAPIQTFAVDPATLLFVLGELPFLTGLYERGRRELTPDDNLSVDGIKEMVLQARDRLGASSPRWRSESRRSCSGSTSATSATSRCSSAGSRPTSTPWSSRPSKPPATTSRWPSPKLPAITPSSTSKPLRTRTLGRSLRVLAPDGHRPCRGSRVGSGADGQPAAGTGALVADLRAEAAASRARPDGLEAALGPVRYVLVASRGRTDRELPPPRPRPGQGGPRRRPGAYARSSRRSFRDGLDIRETLRNWHTGDIYVKVIPPSRGSVEAVVFLFEIPADPQVYTNRATWYAEHAEESTLAFFATDHMANLVGPGIAQADYGGALFLFPPRPIRDIWTDPRLDFADTLEERLLAGAFLHSRERHVAVVSPRPPLASWRRLARRFGRKIVHLPLKRFGGQLIERLRRFHVLNGRTVRSYAADFIRDS